MRRSPSRHQNSGVKNPPRYRGGAPTTVAKDMAVKQGRNEAMVIAMSASELPLTQHPWIIRE